MPQTTRLAVFLVSAAQTPTNDLPMTLLTLPCGCTAHAPSEPITLSGEALAEVRPNPDCWEHNHLATPRPSGYSDLDADDDD